MSLPLLSDPSCHDLDFSLDLDGGGSPSSSGVPSWTTTDSPSDADLDSVVPQTSSNPSASANSNGLLPMDDDALGLLSGLHDLKTEDLLQDVAGIHEVLGDEEPFSFLNDAEWQSLENGEPEGTTTSLLERAAEEGEVEKVRADLMWSAPNLAQLKASRSGSTGDTARWRNISLTLSECADSLFSDVDLDASPEGIAKILGSDSDARLKVDRRQAEHEEEEEEEEIDVVSDAASSVSTESAESSVSHRHWQQHFRAKHQQQQQQRHATTTPTVAAGCSLLRKHHQRGKVAPSAQGPWNTAPLDHSLLDHCYFATTAPASPMSSAPSSPCGAFTNGLLTPNESSDDEDLSRWESKTQSSELHCPSSRKRRRSETKVGLAGKRPRPAEEEAKERVKFKFRMAFKSNNGRSSTSTTSSGSRSLLSGNGKNGGGSKRRSALKNAHCPSPKKNSLSQDENALVNQRLQDEGSDDLLQTTYPSSNGRNPNGRRSKYAGVTSDQKCREIRDLHNSMERQRRVDLKKHFDILKDQIPELIETDKASKLNILNKASEYCRELSASNIQMDEESAYERSRNVMLKKKLQQLSGAINNDGKSFSFVKGKSGKKRTSSGRVSLLSSRLC